MMRLRWSVLAALMAAVFLLGFGFRSLVAQQSAGTLQSTQVLPPDVLPGSLARIPWSTKEDCCPLNSEEERQAFAKSRATAENPKKPASIGLGGMRAYFPLYARTYGETHRSRQRGKPGTAARGTGHGSGLPRDGRRRLSRMVHPTPGPLAGRASRTRF